MSRRHTPAGYDDPGDIDRRGSRDPRAVRDPRDMPVTRERRSSREQPIIRELRARRYPRDAMDYTDPGELEERAEIRVARATRELRGHREPRYMRELRGDTDDIDREGIREQDRVSLRSPRAPRGSEASGETQDAQQGQRYIHGRRYSQDARRVRVDTDEGDAHDERGQRINQPRTRNDLVRQSPRDFDNPQDSNRSFADPHFREYFLPGRGISPEVIAAEIGRYLGPDAVCRAGVNREGAPGYLIRASRPPTRDMISELMAESRLWEEGLERRGGLDSRTQSYRSDDIGDREEHDPRLGRLVPVHARDSQAYSARRESTAEYPSRRLFGRPESMDQRAVMLDRERPNRTDQFLGHGISEDEGSSQSQSSTYDGRWSGTLATQRSSRSSYSTDPSSVQSSTDERRQFLGPNLVQTLPSRSGASHFSSSIQRLPQSIRSYTDPRTSERATVGVRPAAHGRPTRGSAMDPDDDPPDWEETPNFSEGFSEAPTRTHRTTW